MSMRYWIRTAAVISLLAGLTMPSAKAQVSKDLVPEASVPADISKALRDRVTQFFNFHVGPVNRRAIDLVAEDTKDFYFASQKMVLKDFRIDKAEFGKDQNTAVVTVHAARPWDIQGQAVVVDSDMITTWKIEEGKWVWYVDSKDVATTPMGLSNFDGAKKAGNAGELFELNADGTPKIPDDFTTPERLMAQTQKILSQSGLDKTESVLTYGKAGSDVFTFSNGSTGEVLLELAGTPAVPGLKVSLDKRNVKAREKATVRLDYEPPAEAAQEQWVEQSYTVNLVLEPFSRLFPIKITLRPAPAK